MKLKLRVSNVKCVLAVVLSSANIAFADVVLAPFTDVQDSHSTSLQSAGVPVTSYYIGSGNFSGHGTLSNYFETEDLFIPLSEHHYDDTVVFKRIETYPAPETSSIVLFGSGLLTVAGFVRRRKNA